MSNGTYNNVKCVVIGIAAAQASRLQQCLPSVDTLVAVVQCRRRVGWIPTLPALCARVRAGRHQPARSDYWSYAHREQCTRQLALVDFERHVSFFFHLPRVCYLPWNNRYGTVDKSVFAHPDSRPTFGKYKCLGWWHTTGRCALQPAGVCGC